MEMGFARRVLFWQPGSSRVQKTTQLEGENSKECGEFIQEREKANLGQHKRGKCIPFTRQQGPQWGELVHTNASPSAFNPDLSITLSLYLTSSFLKQWERNLPLLQTEKVTEKKHPRTPPPAQAICQPMLLRVGKHGPAYGWCYQESFAGWLFPHVLAGLPSSSSNNNNKKQLQLKFANVVLLHHFSLSISGSFCFPLFFFLWSKMTKTSSPPLDFSFPPSLR